MAIFFQKKEDFNYYNPDKVGSSGGQFLFPGDYLYRHIVAYYCNYLSINNENANSTLITCATPSNSNIIAGQQLVFKTSYNLNDRNFNKQDYVSFIIISNAGNINRRVIIGEGELIDILNNEFTLKVLSLIRTGNIPPVGTSSNILGLFLAKGHVRLWMTTYAYLTDNQINRNYIQANVSASLIPDTELDNYNDPLTQQNRTVSLQNLLYNDFTITNNALSKQASYFTQNSRLGFEIYTNDYLPGNPYNHLQVQLWNFNIPLNYFKNNLRLFIAPVRITAGFPFYHFLQQSKTQTLLEIQNGIRDASKFGAQGLKVPIKIELLNRIGNKEYIYIEPEVGASELLGGTIGTVPAPVSAMTIAGHTGEALIQPAFGELNTNINQLTIQLSNVPANFTSGGWTLNLMQISSLSGLPQSGADFADKYLGSIVSETIIGNAGTYYTYNSATQQLQIHYISDYIDADFFLVSLSYKNGQLGAKNLFLLIETKYQALNPGKDIELILQNIDMNIPAYPMRGGLQMLFVYYITTITAPQSPLDKHRAFIQYIVYQNVWKAGNMEIALKKHTILQNNDWVIDPNNLLLSQTNKITGYNYNWGSLSNYIAGFLFSANFGSNKFLISLNFNFYPHQILLNNPYDQSYQTKLDWLNMWQVLKPLGFFAQHKFTMQYLDLDDNIVKQQIEYRDYLSNDDTQPYDFAQDYFRNAGGTADIKLFNNFLNLSSNQIKINETITLNAEYYFPNSSELQDFDVFLIFEFLFGKEDTLEFSSAVFVTEAIINIAPPLTIINQLNNKIEDLGTININSFFIDTNAYTARISLDFTPSQEGDYVLFANFYVITRGNPIFIADKRGINAKKLAFSVLSDYQPASNQIRLACTTPLFVPKGFEFNFALIDHAGTYTAEAENCQSGAVTPVPVAQTKGLTFGTHQINTCTKINFYDNAILQETISPPPFEPVAVEKLPNDYLIISFNIKGEVINAGIDTQGNSIPVHLLGFGEIAEFGQDFENENYITENWENALIGRQLQKRVTYRLVITHGWQLYTLSLINFAESVSVIYYNKKHPLYLQKVTGVLESASTSYENEVLTANFDILVKKVEKVRVY